jgi:hypothetical protein
MRQELTVSWASGPKLRRIRIRLFLSGRRAAGDERLGALCRAGCCCSRWASTAAGAVLFQGLRRSCCMLPGPAGCHCMTLALQIDARGQLVGSTATAVACISRGSLRTA